MGEKKSGTESRFDNTGLRFGLHLVDIYWSRWWKWRRLWRKRSSVWRRWSWVSRGRGGIKYSDRRIGKVYVLKGQGQ